MLDLAAIRRDTPGSLNITHLDCASQALPAQPVIDAISAQLDRDSFIRNDAHSSQIVARCNVAKLIGAEPARIALTPNGSFAWIQAFLSVRTAPGKVILVSQQEFQTAYVSLRRASIERGVRIRIIPNDVNNVVSVDALGNMIGPDVALLCITHIPANCGTVNPLDTISEIAAAAKLPWILDASQSIGQVPINVADLSCHYLVGTARKYLRGPQGSGFLYVSQFADADAIPPYVDYGGILSSSPGVEYKPTARRYEMSALSNTAIAGLGAAAQYAISLDQSAVWERIRHLRKDLLSKLAYLPVEIYGSDVQKSGIVSLSCSKCDARTLRLELSRRGIKVGLARYSSAPFDVRRPKRDNLRVSVHYYNTEQELQIFCDSLMNVIRQYE